MKVTTTFGKNEGDQRSRNGSLWDHLYGTIVFWLYVEQLTLVELFYHINVFIVVSVSISFFSGNRRGFLYITNASIGV